MKNIELKIFDIEEEFLEIKNLVKNNTSKDFIFKIKEYNIPEILNYCTITDKLEILEKYMSCIKFIIKEYIVKENLSENDSGKLFMSILSKKNFYEL